jgi:hypothetical protein
MTGNANSDIMTTDAPMMPVVAAKDRAHERDGECQSARHGAQQHLQAIEQVPCNAGTLQHGAHQDEHRYRGQNQVLHDAAEHPRRHRAELDEMELAERHAEEAEAKPDAAKHEGHRIA